MQPLEQICAPLRSGGQLCAATAASHVARKRRQQNFVIDVRHVKVLEYLLGRVQALIQSLQHALHKLADDGIVKLWVVVSKRFCGAGSGSGVGYGDTNQPTVESVLCWARVAW
jgi:hypothetical protein